jgi:hypothetical protein
MAQARFTKRHNHDSDFKRLIYSRHLTMKQAIAITYTSKHTHRSSQMKIVCIRSIRSHKRLSVHAKEQSIGRNEHTHTRVLRLKQLAISGLSSGLKAAAVLRLQYIHTGSGAMEVCTCKTLPRSKLPTLSAATLERRQRRSDPSANSAAMKRQGTRAVVR